MISIFEIDSDRGIYWEVYDDSGNFVMHVPSQDDLEWLLDKYRSDGIDFCIHELGGIDEYHVALPSV